MVNHLIISDIEDELAEGRASLKLLHFYYT